MIYNAIDRLQIINILKNLKYFFNDGEEMRQK